LIPALICIAALIFTGHQSASATPPIFQNRTPVGFSVADSATTEDFVAGSNVGVRVDLNQAATRDYPVIGNFHALERSVQLSTTDTDGMQIDVAVVNVAPFGAGSSTSEPPIIHMAWIEASASATGPVFTNGTTPAFEIMYANSDDGGATFTTPVSATNSRSYYLQSTAGAGASFSTLDLEVDSGGHPRIAYAFVSTADRTADRNVYFNYSQDGGQTWSTPLTVNDQSPPVNAGSPESRSCAFPRLAIDDRDNIFIAYVRGASTGGGADDVMLAKVNRESYNMVLVGSLGTVGSSGGVRLTPNAKRHTGPDLAVGDGDALHLVYFSDADDRIEHKRMTTDTTWADYSPAGWDGAGDGAAIGSFVDEWTGNAGLEQDAKFYFPTIVVDRNPLPDRVYSVYKYAAGPSEESILLSRYDDDGTTGTGISWSTASSVWGGSMFADGDLKYGIELDWTITGRVSAVVEDRLDDRGDLHIAFAAGYSNTGAGAPGEHDVYYARYNGASWTLPEKVADDDSDSGTQDGIAATDDFLLSPALAMHPDLDHVFLAFAGGSDEGFGVKGVTDVNHHPYFKVLGRDLAWEDESVPTGGYEYNLLYTPTNAQTVAAEITDNPVYVHVADPGNGAGLGARGSSSDGFLTGDWEQVGSSLQDTDKRYEGLVDEDPLSNQEWGDDDDKIGLLVKLNILGSDSTTNLQAITNSTASAGASTFGARTVRVGASPPVAFLATGVGSYFALGADIDIVPTSAVPTVSVSQPDGTGDVANADYLIEYDFDDTDDSVDGNLDVALYAYASDGLQTVQDIRIFGTLIADHNDRSLRNSAGTDDLTQGNGDYLWDDPPSGLKTSALFGSIRRVPSGNYYIYMTVDDGKNAAVFAVSSGPVTIAHTPIVEAVDPIVAETVDTGVRTGANANPYDLDLSVVDYDGDAMVQLFYAAPAGITSASATGVYPNQTFVLGKSVSGTLGTPITSTTSLSTQDHEYSWDVSDPVVPEGAYYVYAVATDSTSVTVGHSSFRLTVTHSPSFEFYEPAPNTQRTIDTGSQPVYVIQWQKGPGDSDLDDDASIAFYYTRVDPATKNYAGTDSTDLLDNGDGDATLIVGNLAENGDGADDMYVWDLRTATSPPVHERQVWLYAVTVDGAGNTSVVLGGGLVLRHSPHILLKSRLPRINQGDIVRLDWDDYLVDDGSSTDDAYIRLYASPQTGLTSLADLESRVVGAGSIQDTYIINSSDGTASGTITAIGENDDNAVTWDTYTSSLAVSEGSYAVYAGISTSPTFSTSTQEGVSESSNLLSVGGSTGTTPHMALSPTKVLTSKGDTLTFDVLVQSEGLPASAVTAILELGTGPFTVLTPASPFTDPDLVFAGGTEIENTTDGTQIQFSKMGTPEIIGTTDDLIRLASFQVEVGDITGTHTIAFDEEEAGITIVDRSIPLRRRTGMSARDASVQGVSRGRIKAVVRLEGRAPPLGDGDHSTMLDVHLRLPGSTVDITDALYVAANDDVPGTADTVEVQTNSGGDLSLASVPAGRYVLSVKDTSHLSGRTDTLIIRNGESITLDASQGLYASDIRGDPSFLLAQNGAVLQAGDVTEDNEIDEDDVNAIDAAWGSDDSEPWFEQADLNNDGRVGVLDLTAASSNISNTTGFGAPPVFKARSRGARPAAGGPMAEVEVTLEASGTAGGWRSGDQVELILRAHGLDDLAGYELEIAFDPTEMGVLRTGESRDVGGVFAANPQGRFSRLTREPGLVCAASARRGRSWSAYGAGELLRLHVVLLQDGFPASLTVRDGTLLSSVYESAPIRLLSHPAGSVLPQSLVLGQNYPNPFNPTTTIPFSVPATTALLGGGPVPVTLEIFNILGQQVRTLIREERVPGHYQAAWDGRDGGGHTVASGIYYYRLRAGDTADARAMALTR